MFVLLCSLFLEADCVETVLYVVLVFIHFCLLVFKGSFFDFSYFVSFCNVYKLFYMKSFF